MDPTLAPRRDPPVHHQPPQHLLPRHFFAARRHARLPKPFQAQRPPQIARQPAVAERTRPAQFQPAQLHLEAIDRALGNLAIVGKQTQRPASLLLLVEHVQRFQPRRLLRVIDFPQVHHRPLDRLPRRHPTILHDAEVAMILAVFLARRGPQKHPAQDHRNRGRNTEGRSSPQPNPTTRGHKHWTFGLRPRSNALEWARTAKVRLARAVRDRVRHRSRGTVRTSARRDQEPAVRQHVRLMGRPPSPGYTDLAFPFAAAPPPSLETTDAPR